MCIICKSEGPLFCYPPLVSHSYLVPEKNSLPTQLYQLSIVLFILSVPGLSLSKLKCDKKGWETILPSRGLALVGNK